MSDRYRTVFINANYNGFGSAGCSGFQFDNVIIIHGSVLHCLASRRCSISETNDITKNLQIIVNEVKQQQYFVHSEKSKQTVDFEIVKMSDCHVNPLKSDIDTSQLGYGALSGPTYSSEEVTLCLIYEFEKNVISNSIFNYEYSRAHNIDRNNSYEYLVLPIFIFLMTGIPDKYMFHKALNALLRIINGISLYPGLSIAVESTPFSCVALYKSLSRGIISKTLGPDQEGLVIDTRLSFDSEGAPIYVFEEGSKSKGAVIGIVFCVISRNATLASGFTLGLSLKHLINAVLGLKAIDYIPFNEPKLDNHHPFLDMDLLSSAVLFVRCQNKWGSGVVVDAELGLVLTCSHNVYHAQDSVCVVHKGKKYCGVVLYASPPSYPYDLALLSVGKIPGLRSLVLASKSPDVGEPVINVGHALANESSVVDSGTPTLSSGYVSKVSRRGGPLQMTACTQSGMSGGAVLRPPDQLVGIIVSNLQVNSSVLPFFGFAVSVDDFGSAITQFILTRDPACLESLTPNSPELRMMWMLQDSKL